MKNWRVTAIFSSEKQEVYEFYYTTSATETAIELQTAGASVTIERIGG